jgi:putative MFS transporter
MSFSSLGAWAARYVYTPESYPTRVRATGIALAVFGFAFIAGALAIGLLGEETPGRALADS